MRVRVGVGRGVADGAAPRPRADDALARADAEEPLAAFLEDFVTEVRAFDTEGPRGLLKCLDEISTRELSGGCISHRWVPFVRVGVGAREGEPTGPASGRHVFLRPARPDGAGEALDTVGGKVRLRRYC